MYLLRLPLVHKFPQNAGFLLLERVHKYDLSFSMSQPLPSLPPVPGPLYILSGKVKLVFPEKICYGIFHPVDWF